MKQLVPNRERHKNMIEKLSQDFPTIDQNQIMEWTASATTVLLIYYNAPEAFNI
jgi:hypothetical protein